MAFLYFRKKKCDLAVVEAGLGGALDATNIIHNTVCAAFASISRDHLGVIGNSLEEIAENKAGIIKPGCTVVSVQQKECVDKILEKQAQKLGCSYIRAEQQEAELIREDYRGITLSYKEFRRIHTAMAGRNQIGNAVTALEIIRVLRRLGYDIPEEAVEQGMEQTVWPGRFSCIGDEPTFIIDGAHNEDAARKLRESVEMYFPGRRLLCIMGVFKDKEYDKMAQIMGPLASVIYPVALPDRKRGLAAGKTGRGTEAVLPLCKSAGQKHVGAGGTERGSDTGSKDGAGRGGKRRCDSGVRFSVLPVSGKRSI